MKNWGKSEIKIQRNHRGLRHHWLQHRFRIEQKRLENAEYKYNSRVVNILKKNNRVAGVELEDGTRVEASVVINASGPHSL